VILIDPVSRPVYGKSTLPQIKPEMKRIESFGNDKTTEWIVQKNETYQFFDSSFEDIFFPRPYASVIFHFKNRAAIPMNTEIVLDPFFAAPVIPQAIPLRFEGDIDTLGIHVHSKSREPP